MAVPDQPDSLLRFRLAVKTRLPVPAAKQQLPNPSKEIPKKLEETIRVLAGAVRNIRTATERSDCNA